MARQADEQPPAQATATAPAGVHKNFTANPERVRLEQDLRHRSDWRLWGPYLPERQWATVREDYSSDGSCWEYFPHDHARSRIYRWGEDGLLGLCDRECRMCFAPALWNGRDTILKERLFGLTGNEGNHGEDVKEYYFYLDASPTGSYLKALYKYPQAAYPYEQLVAENRRRSRSEPEFELLDTGIFDGSRYFDVFVEYAQAGEEDILARFTICNRGPEAARIDVLPTLWFRNTWSWGRSGDGYWPRPLIEQIGDGVARAKHETLGTYLFTAGRHSAGGPPELLFTDNATNLERLYRVANSEPYVKDAFHRYVVNGEREAVNPRKLGTKVAAHYSFEVPGGGQQILRVRFCKESEVTNGDTGRWFDKMFERRRLETDRFYSDLIADYEHVFVDLASHPSSDRPQSSAQSDDGKPQPNVFARAVVQIDSSATPDDTRLIMRGACAGLIWSTQFYHYVVDEWLEGDSHSTPPPERLTGRNSNWTHLNARELISMPDKWEYPWFAAWDLGFQANAFIFDPAFAKSQLELMLRETYMNPNGQIPAYEFALGDVNPPVHAWAAYRIYKATALQTGPDYAFLARVFQKLLLNFTWWVNRKDPDGKNIFTGGFLGLDNIGAFDRSKPLPQGGHLEQADGTAWMAFYCAMMLSIALELASHDPVYEDIAYKFLEHFASIIEAMHTLGGRGLWDEEDGFYYDKLIAGGQQVPVRVRSMVGLIPLLAASVVESGILNKTPEFFGRVKWFQRNRPHLARHFLFTGDGSADLGQMRGLLAVASRDRLVRVLRYLLDESEFLSPYGIRSISRYHKDHPYIFSASGSEYRVDYVPGESNSSLFGGNSNWRGPIWFPINFLLIEALEIQHLFYRDDLLVECPTGSGRMMNLYGVASEIARRLTRIFLPDRNGRRPCHGDDPRFANDPYWRDLLLFYEYFHGDTGRGLGASHQTGWTALVFRCLRRPAERFQRYQYEARAELPEA